MRKMKFVRMFFGDELDSGELDIAIMISNSNLVLLYFQTIIEIIREFVIILSNVCFLKIFRDKLCIF